MTLLSSRTGSVFATIPITLLQRHRKLSTAKGHHCARRCHHQPNRCSKRSLAHPQNESRPRPVPRDGKAHFPGNRVLSLSAVAVNYNYPFTLQQLFTLKAVAATGNLDDAAAALSTSRHSVLYLLKRLEKELNTELVKHSQNGRVAWTTLTEAGQLLLRYTDRLGQLATDAQAAVRDLQEVRTGSVYVAASQTTGVYVLPTLIERYKRKHANVSVQLQVENTRRCCAAVVRGEADVAVVGGEIPRDLEHLLLVTPYQEDAVVLVVGRDHALAGREDLDKEELHALHFVSLYKSSTVQAVRTVLESHGIDWRHLSVVMEVNSVEAIKQSVAAGLGCAFLSAAAVAREAEAGSLRALRIRGVNLNRVLMCVTDPQRYCSKAVRAFIREMYGVGMDTCSQGCIPPRLLDLEEAPRLSPAEARRRSPALAARQPSLIDNAAAIDADGVPLARAGEGPPPPGSLARPPSGGSGPTNPAADAAAGARLPFTLAQLVVFWTIAHAGSGVAAAGALSISQPAVSKSMAALEQAFGDTLVVRRIGGGLTWLTEAGTALLPFCDAALGVASEALRALGDLRSAHSGRVRLAASQTVGTYVMPRLLASFRAAHPRVVVTLQVDISRRVCASVASGAVDCAIIGGDVPEELASGLEVVPYAEDELVLVVPPGDALAERGCIEVAELYGLSLVGLNQGSSVQAVQKDLLRRHGILWRHLHIEVEFDSIEAIKGAVQHGLGAAFVSRAAIVKEEKLGLLTRVEIAGVRLTRRLALVSCPTRHHSAAAQKFLERLRGPTASAAELQKVCRGYSAYAYRSAAPASLPWEDTHYANGAGGGPHRAPPAGPGSNGQ